MSCLEDDEDIGKAVCGIGFCTLIVSIVLLVYGAEQFKGSVEYADNATKEECTIIDYDQKACSYKCAGDNRAGENCDGHTLTYYANSTKCVADIGTQDNNISTTTLLIDFECYDRTYESEGYYINNTYTCYILPCNEDGETRFSFTNYEITKKAGIVLTIMGVVLLVCTVAFCGCGYRYMIKIMD